MQHVLDLLREPLLVLSGTPVTLLSILTAAAIVAVARLVAALLSRSVARVFTARGVDPGVGFSIAKITRWVIMLVGLLVALTTVGMDLGAVYALSAVLLVGIGFGLQKVAENFVSGLILLLERPLRVGDFVEVEGCKGTVRDIGLRASRLVTRDGLTYIIPNGDLIAKRVTNYTAPTTTMRIWVKVGVAYDTDLAAAAEVLREVAAAEPLVLADPAPEVRHDGFADSAITLALVCWIGDADDDDEATSALNFAIAKAFAARGIAIPFPQRDLHVRSLPAS